MSRIKERTPEGPPQHPGLLQRPWVGHRAHRENSFPLQCVPFTQSLPTERDSDGEREHLRAQETFLQPCLSPTTPASGCPLALSASAAACHPHLPTPHTLTVPSACSAGRLGVKHARRYEQTRSPEEDVTRGPLVLYFSLHKHGRDEAWKDS